MTEKEIVGQISIFDLGLWCGKTSQAHSVATAAKTSAPSSKKQRGSQIKTPLFLDLRGGRWTPSGCIMGDGWSIAWRLHDAQFWGVPQRRKRIALVADFGGESAPEILFERKGVSGDFDPRGTQGKGTPAETERSVGEPGKCLKGGGAISFQERAGKPGGGKGILIQDERTGALSTLNNQSVFCLQGNGIDRTENSGCNGKGWRENEAYTLNTMDRHAVAIGADLYSGTLTGDIATTITAGTGSSAPHSGPSVVYDGNRRHNYKEFGEICETVLAHYGTGGGNVPLVRHGGLVLESEPYATSHGGFMLNADESGIAHTLQATDHKDPQMVAYGLDRAAFNQGKNAKFGFSVEEEKIGAQVAKGPGAVCSSVVRRLTPLECERLQGYPDGWTNIGDWIDSKGKKHKGEADSPRYKALGNSIALPFWAWMAERMLNVLRADKVQELTMASLFDGIGGFPLVFSRHGCAPVWASEIEEFPIAVTKLRFGEE